MTPLRITAHTILPILVYQYCIPIQWTLMPLQWEWRNITAWRTQENTASDRATILCHSATNPSCRVDVNNFLVAVASIWHFHNCNCNMKPDCASILRLDKLVESENEAPQKMAYKDTGNGSVTHQCWIRSGDFDLRVSPVLAGLLRLPYL